MKYYITAKEEKTSCFFLVFWCTKMFQRTLVDLYGTVVSCNYNRLLIVSEMF